MKNLVISGLAGSGKSYLANAVAVELDMKMYSFSDQLRLIAAQRGMQDSRKNLVQLGRLLAEEYGDKLVKYLIGESNIAEPIVFDGVREVGPLIELIKIFPNTLIVFLDISRDERKRRIFTLRNRFSDAGVNFEYIEKSEIEIYKTQDIKNHANLIFNDGHNIANMIEIIKKSIIQF